MDVVAIDDPSDPRVSAYFNLTDAQLRRGVEAPRPDAPHGRFIAEGSLVIRRLVRSHYQVRSLLLVPARLDELRADLRDVDAPVYVAELDVMRAVAGFNVHRGALAEAARCPPVATRDVLASAETIAILEGINDLENMGTIFRNAAALGVDGVLLCPRCCDPLSRRSVRVSMGSVLEVLHARIDEWPGGLEEVRRAGFELVALTPDPAATPIEAATVSRPALLLGGEGPGLTPAVLALADVRVRIPMRPGTDSLNVGNAASVAFHRFAKVGTEAGMTSP